MKISLLFNNNTVLALLAIFGCLTSLTTFASKSKAVDFNEIIIDSPYKLTQEIIAADVLPSKGTELINFFY